MLNLITSRITVPARIKAVMATLGISGDEKTALDEVVASIGTNPFLTVVTGKAFESVEDVTSFFLNTKSDVVSPEVGSKIRGLLAVPGMRKNIADFIVSKINESQNAKMLYSVLEKVSQAPIEGFGDSTHVDLSDFIARGLLPLLESYIPAQDEQIPVVVHKCPFCKEIFIEN